MSAYPHDAYPHDPYARGFDAPVRGGRGRPAVEAGRLWAGGAAAALVAALVAMVGVLAARGLFDVELLAPSSAGAWGDASTAWLIGVAAAAALLATAIMHLLLAAAPQPFAYFGWIVGLVTVGATLWPYATDADTGAKVATSVIYLVIGIAIGTLVHGAGIRSVRRRSAAPGPSGP